MSNKELWGIPVVEDQNCPPRLMTLDVVKGGRENCWLTRPEKVREIRLVGGLRYSVFRPPHPYRVLADSRRIVAPPVENGRVVMGYARRIRRVVELYPDAIYHTQQVKGVPQGSMGDVVANITTHELAHFQFRPSFSEVIRDPVELTRRLIIAGNSIGVLLNLVYSFQHIVAPDLIAPDVLRRLNDLTTASSFLWGGLKFWSSRSEMYYDRFDANEAMVRRVTGNGQASVEKTRDVIRPRMLVPEDFRFVSGHP